jgi:hypothetical protein
MGSSSRLKGAGRRAELSLSPWRFGEQDEKATKMSLKAEAKRYSEDIRERNTGSLGERALREENPGHLNRKSRSPLPPNLPQKSSASGITGDLNYGNGSIARTQNTTSQSQGAILYFQIRALAQTNLTRKRQPTR